MPPWLLLTLAIVTEVVGTVALRYSEGFSRVWPSLVVAVGYGLSVLFLALTLKHLSIGVTYAVWAGAGTAAIALIGVVALGEATALKLGSIALIVIGVVGLNLADTGR